MNQFRQLPENDGKRTEGYEGYLYFRSFSVVFAQLTYAHAGAMLSLLDWWLSHGMKETPAEMDDLFHRMVWHGMTNAGNLDWRRVHPGPSSSMT